MHKFICGCQLPTRERLEGDPELTSLDTVMWDSEGFLTCSVHHMRIYGWRVPTHKPLPLGMAGITELEWQTWMLFGTIPAKPQLGVTDLISPSARHSMRDSRDPAEDYEAIMLDVLQDRALHLSKKTVGGNGNGHYSFSNGRPIMAGEPHGNAQMQYQRELAQAQVISKTSTELAAREVGF